MTSVLGGFQLQQPDNWSELASLIDTLLDAAPDERPALIDGLSHGDPARRRELEKLLGECEQDLTLLSRPAADLFSAMFDEDVSQFPASLVDRYRVIRDLGHGGMATVFHARDLKHGRDVAVKVVHPHLGSALGPDRFLHEIEIVSQLHHPHIVPLYDSGNSDGFLYYVMPYEPGLSLRQRLARHTALTPKQVVGILRDVCDALSYAHERGIVHRDIKPDNVLMSGRHAMVTDFGVAKAATDAAVATTAARLPVGTPAYMAPEQIEPNRSIDHRADIYALGVLGYELLAGQPPFIGRSRDDILASHLTEEPAQLSTICPEAPEELTALVMKSLQKNPDNRWQSADELLQHLEALAVGATAPSPVDAPRRSRWIVLPPLAALALLVAGATVMSRREANVANPSTTAKPVSWAKRFSAARIERLTDFPGSEVDATISANGDFVAFLADRHNVFDAFVTQLGSEQLLNLTGGLHPRLFDQNVGSIGFSSDGAHVWIREGAVTAPQGLSLRAMPGGRSRLFLANAVTAVWSPDGSRIVYREASPGDPIYVTDGEGHNPRQIFVAEPGLHNHDLTWSPDGQFIYFVHGLPPDVMDVWRVPASGGKAERITSQRTTIAHPQILDAHTLVYTATASDGTGPWLYLFDLNNRASRRVSSGVDHYTSVATSNEIASQGRRLVSTISNPRARLWTVEIGDGVAKFGAAKPLMPDSVIAGAPRFGAHASLIYLRSSNGAQSVWRRLGNSTREIWPGERGAVMAPAAVSPDGRQLCVVRRSRDHSALHCMAADGTADRIISGSLDVKGAPSWSPDGNWIAFAAADSTDAVHVYKIGVAGGNPIRLVDSVSSGPVWSPTGKFIVYSGPSRDGVVPVRAVTPAGKPYPLAPLSVEGGGDSYRFLSDDQRLIVKLGDTGHSDFWLFDLSSGTRRRLTRLQPGQSIKRFDVSPDGRRIVFDRVRENSDVVLIELPPR